jgi:hypothetical protein
MRRSHCTAGAQASPTTVWGWMMDQDASVVFPSSKLRADLASTGTAASCQHCIVEDPLTDASAEMLRGAKSLVMRETKLVMANASSPGYIFRSLFPCLMGTLMDNLADKDTMRHTWAFCS